MNKILGGVAQDGDQLRLGHIMPDAPRRLLAVEVVGASLAHGGLVGDVAEQGAVSLKVGDRPPGPIGPGRFGVPKERAAEVGVLALKSEEPQLLYGAHVDLRVLLEVVVERGSAGLMCAYNEEVGQRHGRFTLATPRGRAR